MPDRITFESRQQVRVYFDPRDGGSPMHGPWADTEAAALAAFHRPPSLLSRLLRRLQGD